MDDILKREQLLAELEQARELSEDGLLHPQTAVQWARQHPDSVLHSRIEWDDTKAAENYRIDQVRQLIRVVVTTSADTGRQIRAYVSVPSDRVHGGGYRRSQEALLAARQELVADALNELRRLPNRYTHLPELGTLFQSIIAVIDDFRTSQRETA